MIDLELRVTGVIRGRDRFDRFARRANDLSDVLDGPVADALMEDQRKVFARPPGPALKRSTIRRKRKAGQSTKKLHATGALERSMTVRGDANQRLRASSNELVFGTTLRYAPFVARQRRFNKVRRPARRAIERAVTDALMERN
jgi:phage gpG-like protein